MLSAYTLTRRVLFHETDMAGVVHFSCYFRYMEEAEHALWREAGLSIARRDGEIGWPRVAASFEFLKPLYFEDEFQARVRITAITNRTIRYSCALTKAGETIATGTMAIACVVQQPNEPMRSIAIPPAVVERLGVDTEPDQARAADAATSAATGTMKRSTGEPS
jgi:YbgC/YbaW family acyl-CoA thioester hydrolase